MHWKDLWGPYRKQCMEWTLRSRENLCYSICYYFESILPYFCTYQDSSYEVACVRMVTWSRIYFVRAAVILIKFASLCQTSFGEFLRWHGRFVFLPGPELLLECWRIITRTLIIQSKRFSHRLASTMIYIYIVITRILLSTYILYTYNPLSDSVFTWLDSC